MFLSLEKFTVCSGKKIDSVNCLITAYRYMFKRYYIKTSFYIIYVVSPSVKLAIKSSENPF